MWPGLVWAGNQYCLWVALCCPVSQVCATPVSYNSCLNSVQCRVFVICWFPCRSVLIVALLCVWPYLSTSLSPCYSVLFCIVFICIHPCPLVWSCSSFYKVVTEFLRQSGISCPRDRTHPGTYLLYVRPRRTDAGIVNIESFNCRIKLFENLRPCLWTDSTPGSGNNEKHTAL